MTEASDRNFGGVSHTGEPQRKRHRLYWLWRVYAVCGIVAFMCAWVLGFFRLNVSLGAIVTIIVLPLNITIFPMVYTLTAFPFKYSLFGPYKRRSAPREKPVFVEKTLRGAVGKTTFQFWGSLFRWSVYRNGLGIRIPWCGRAFIPFESFRSLERRGKMLFGYRLEHDSPDVRSPVWIPSTEVVRAIERALAGYVGTNNATASQDAGAQRQDAET